MKVTLEMIDELRKRANVGYKEAKEALERFEGDMVEALSYLDGEKKIKNSGINGSSIWDTCKGVIGKLNKIKLRISKNDNTILNIPSTIAILIGLVTLPIFIGALLLAIITGCKIRLIKENGEDFSINKHIEKVSVIVNDTAQKVTEDLKNA